jgi:peptidoglycan hydrolase CwlO-like protein
MKEDLVEKLKEEFIVMNKIMAVVLIMILSACSQHARQKKELYEKRKKQVQQMDRESLLVFVKQQDEVLIDLKNELKNKVKELDEAHDKLARMDSVKTPHDEEMAELKADMDAIEADLKKSNTKIKELEWEVRECENRKR